MIKGVPGNGLMLNMSQYYDISQLFAVTLLDDKLAADPKYDRIYYIEECETSNEVHEMFGFNAAPVSFAGRVRLERFVVANADEKITFVDMLGPLRVGVTHIMAGRSELWAR